MCGSFSHTNITNIWWRRWLDHPQALDSSFRYHDFVALQTFGKVVTHRALLSTPLGLDKTGSSNTGPILRGRDIKTKQSVRLDN